MITQEQFDVAYEKIAKLRDLVTAERRKRYKDATFDPMYHRAYGQDQGLSQALAFLEDADRGELTKP